MTQAAELRTFTRVRIAAEGLGGCIGRIEDIRTPAELPDIPDGMPAELPRSVFEEWGVSRIALISYYAFPEQQYLFCALEIKGRWYDLRRQELTLEVVGQYEWPQLRSI
jgi:hypothetical protein